MIEIQSQRQLTISRANVHYKIQENTIKKYIKLVKKDSKNN